MDLTIFWRLLAMLSAGISSAWTARAARSRSAALDGLADPDADTIPIAPIDLELARSSAPEHPDTLVSDATEMLVALREGAGVAGDSNRRFK